MHYTVVTLVFSRLRKLLFKYRWTTHTWTLTLALLTSVKMAIWILKIARQYSYSDLVSQLESATVVVS